MLQDEFTCSVSQATVWRSRHLTNWLGLQMLQSVWPRLSLLAVVPGALSLRIFVHAVSPSLMPVVPTGTSDMPITTSVLIPSTALWACHCFSRIRPSSCTLTRSTQATTRSSLLTFLITTSACEMMDTCGLSLRITPLPTWTLPASHSIHPTRHVSKDFVAPSFRALFCKLIYAVSKKHQQHLIGCHLSKHNLILIISGRSVTEILGNQ